MFQRFLLKLRGAGRKPKMAALQPDQLVNMVQAIAATQPVEIGCDECYEQLDRFVELELAGKNAADALPLVREHLDRCRDCREEFELLLSTLKAEIGEA